ncbi:long-chain-fatty-acid--CoA ligase [Solirubrobacter taibaiensis]|nr:long-chain-fatty-acid--CoA ligase [Solirubrobacter taibaiensis]
MPQPHASRRSHWVNHLERHAHGRPDDVALRFRGETTTWSELQNRVEQLAAALAARGVAAGDRVAMLMGNRPEYVEALLATNRLGAIGVPVNFRLAAGEIAYILENSGAAVLFVDELGAETGEQAAGQAEHDVELIGVDELSAVLEKEHDAPPVVDVPEDSPALIMYTSGTTGRPKGAVLTHMNLLSESVVLIRAYQLVEADEVNLVASPMFHIGAIGSIAPLILIGGTMVILPSGAFEPAAVVQLLEEERVTSAFLVPSAWQLIVDHDSVPDRDLSRLRTTSWGAAPATHKLLTKMAEVFPDALNVAVFGQTEMSPITCVLEGKDALRKIGSVGKPVPTVALRIVDAEMHDVPQGEVGEIVYRGTGLMSGYWRNDAATDEAFEGGWFHSGDMVRQDDEGFLYVVDRAKDMIISGGENIYCAEVENALSNHPAIAEVSLIARESEKWGETPVAVIVPADDSEALTIEALREWAGEHLARYKLPTALELVDELPRNAAGKVLKPELRERFGSSS